MKSKSILYLLSLSLILVVTSCSSPPDPEIIEVTREVTSIVKETVVITELVVITATPVPPTPTPQPTPTLAYVQWTSQDTVNAFLSADLEAESTRPMTKDDYGFGPMVAIEGTHFLVPSLCPTCGGRIMSFDSPEKLAQSKEYYVSLGEASALFFSWTLERDNILVQINGDLSEEKAIQYQTALEGMEK